MSATTNTATATATTAAAATTAATSAAGWTTTTAHAPGARTTMTPPDYRPAIHFAPRRNWMNDPNGLVFHDNRYHLFFQHNPHGDDWGNMSWGHATSRDLEHWDEHPVALEADAGEAVFSGSIVRDVADTSGLGRDGVAPLVAIYTSVAPSDDDGPGIQAQCLASSTDDGETWTRYPGNPVLDRGSSEFRDPKMFRHGDHWILVAVEALDRTVVLYRSDDLRHWTHLSDFGPAGSTEGVWECPDLFPLADQDGDVRWVLIVSVGSGGPAGGSATQCFVGDFDGEAFTEERVDWLDHGRDYYAAVSYSDAPHGRRLMIGWMSNWDYAARTPTDPWRGAMALPRELSLHAVDGTQRIRQRPAASFAQARPVHALADGIAFRGDPAPWIVEVGVRMSDARGRLEVHLGAGDDEVRVGWADGILFLDRTRSGDVGFDPSFASVERVEVPALDDALRLTIVVDRCSVEVFAHDGLWTVTDLVFPRAPFDSIRIDTDAGAELRRFDVVEVR